VMCKREMTFMDDQDVKGAMTSRLAFHYDDTIFAISDVLDRGQTIESFFFREDEERIYFISNLVRLFSHLLTSGLTDKYWAKRRVHVKIFYDAIYLCLQQRRLSILYQLLNESGMDTWKTLKSRSRDAVKNIRNIAIDIMSLLMCHPILNEELLTDAVETLARVLTVESELSVRFHA